MRFIYTIVLYAIVPWLLLHLWWRGRIDPAYRKRWRERFGYCLDLVNKSPAIWIHAVSVGEVQASLSLVQLLLIRYPNHQIIITTTTPTGAARVESELGDTVRHFYVPYDLPVAIERFLSVVNPALVVIMETELWPNLFYCCHRRSIPLILVNMRLSERSTHGYSKFPALVREMLSYVDTFTVQTEVDAQRLQVLGAPQARIYITGNIKFDAKLPQSLKEEGQALRRILGVSRSVWIAASTHAGEDEIVLDAHNYIRARMKDCLLVLVPRHPERFEYVVGLAKRRGLKVAVWTERPQQCNNIDVVVGNTMGELPVFYSASDVSFVGGSLVKSGGHNLLEAAALSLPIFVGAHTFNFSDSTCKLIDLGVCERVDDAASLAQGVIRYFEDANLRYRVGETAVSFVARNQGAAHRIMRIIEGIIPSSH